jgi:hypothetical protein
MAQKANERIGSEIMDRKPARRRKAAPRGKCVRASGKDGPQIVRSSGHRWTEESEEIFLDRLAASNNATWAAEECGFSREAIYARARRDPPFAERMAAARAVGYGSVDDGLAKAADDFLAGRPRDPNSPILPMTVQDAIAILKLHRTTQSGGEGGSGRRPAWPARRRSLEEVHESILRKISAIARKRGLL